MYTDHEGVITTSMVAHQLVAKQQANSRWFWRCLVCLGVFTVEQENPAHLDVCPYCGTTGKLNRMGRVFQGVVVADKIVSVCDDRCTYALGPQCVCHCGGVNHGSRLVVSYVQEVGSLSGSWQLVNASKKKLLQLQTQAMAFTIQYENVAKAVKAAIEPLREKKASGEWLTSEEYAVWWGLPLKLRKAAEGKVHSNRMKKLDLILQEAIAATPAPEKIDFTKYGVEEVAE